MSNDPQMKTPHLLAALLLTALLIPTAFASKPATVKRGPISQPMYLVNGVEMDNITHLDPHDIERLTVLRDSVSVARYSDRGYNGIIVADLKYVRDTLITPHDEAPYVVADQMPQFRAAPDLTFNEWARSQIRYPRKAARRDIDGNVNVTFIIEKDGRVRFCRVNSSPDKLLSAEAVRILRSMPAWTPGFKDGQPVRVKSCITLEFRIPGKYYIPIRRIR